jgi:hypothetical protein
MPASRLRIYIVGNLRDGEKLEDQELGGWTMWMKTSGKWDLQDGGERRRIDRNGGNSLRRPRPRAVVPWSSSRYTAQTCKAITDGCDTPNKLTKCSNFFNAIDTEG